MMKVILSPECTLSPEKVIASFVESAKNPDGLELTIQQDENSLSSLLGKRRGSYCCGGQRRGVG